MKMLLSDLTKPVARDGSKPAHQQVRELLLEVIKQRLMSAGDKLPSEEDIAEAMGVSRMTANKAILSLVSDGWLARVKGKGTFISDSLRTQKVKAAVVMAEDLAGAIDNYYFGSIYFSLVKHAEALGAHLELLSLNKLISSELDANSFDGLILVNPPLYAVTELTRKGVTSSEIVVLGSNWPGSGLSCIDSDNIAGSALAVNHLVSKGHQNLLFVGACPDDANSIDRLRGFEIAAKVAGDTLTTVAPWSPTAVSLTDEARTFIEVALRSADPPTAIVAAGAIIALQVSNLVHKMGLIIPDDVAIVGYDDPSFLNASAVPISTLAQPIDAMAELAVRELIRLHTNPLARPAVYLRHSELIERESSKTPRSST